MIKIILLLFFSLCVHAEEKNVSEKITVHIFNDEGEIYKTFAIDGRIIVYNVNGLFSYHDRSEVHPTFTVFPGVGVSYSFFNEKGDILGFVEDKNQDGDADVRVWYTGKIEVKINNKWYIKENDKKGMYIYIDSKKKYLSKNNKYGKYEIKE